MNQMMMQAMQALQEMKKRTEEAERKLKDMELSIDGADGKIRVTFSGEITVKRIVIDDELRRNEEAEMLEDLLVATINRGIREATAMKEGEMKKATEGLLPSIPGFDFPIPGM